jgi:hypothetical protein
MKMFAYLLAALVALAGASVAQAQSDTSVIHGTVERVDHANNRVFVKGDDGRDYAVDIAQGHASGDARTVGQEVTVYGRRTGQNRIEATHITADRDYRSATPAERERFRPRGSEQLHGQVVSIEGSDQRRLRLKTDDGQNVIVDISGLPDRREEMVRALRPGAAITVIGDGDSRSDRFVARNIRFDDKDLNRRALSGSGGSTVAGGNRTIRGTVVDVEGANQHLVRLRTDDGRTVMVDMSNLPDRREDVVRRLRTGASVTVVGDDSRADRFVAREIRWNDSDVAGGSTGAAGGNRTIRGTVVDVEGAQQHLVRLRTDDGKTVMVDMSSLPDRREDMVRRLRAGASVTVIGDDSRSDRFVAREIRFNDRDVSGQPAGTATSGEVQVAGTIDTIHQDNMRLKTDDGRIIRVNIDPVRDNVRERIKVGQRVTVVGVYTDKDANKNEMTARTVRVDGAQSSAPAATSGEQQVRGTIETIDKDNLRLRVDDGRIIRVNIDPLRDNVRERIKVGQKVTVMGVYTDKDANKNEMTARTVRVDDAASASPATNRPRNADDCKDRGWTNYNNPKFKNQGDCVSYVNSRK